MKKTLFILAVMIGLVAISACGRVSKPMKPKDSVYPKEYTVKP